MLIIARIAYIFNWQNHQRSGFVFVHIVRNAYSMSDIRHAPEDIRHGAFYSEYHFIAFLSLHLLLHLSLVSNKVLTR